MRTRYVYNWISCLIKVRLICHFPEKSSDACLAAFIVANSSLAGKFEGSATRPDLVFAWTTYEVAQGMINSERIEPIKNGDIHWNELVSYMEVKANSNAWATTLSQTMSYCHILPRAQPDLAGIEYSLITPELLYLFWGDTSGVVRTHRYFLENFSSRDILFRYIATLVDPLPELPVRDSTMKLDRTNESYTIQCNDITLKNCKLISSTAGQCRQTCVFLAEDGRRVVKDLWLDEKRRFKEANILEEIKGVPGVVQVDFSLDVKIPETGEFLQTSELHSGSNSKLRKDRKAPRRMKTRCVLKSTGKKLKTRKSVLQVVKGIHDSLRGTAAYPKMRYKISYPLIFV